MASVGTLAVIVTLSSTGLGQLLVGFYGDQLTVCGALAARYLVKFSKDAIASKDPFGNKQLVRMQVAKSTGPFKKDNFNRRSLYISCSNQKGYATGRLHRSTPVSLCFDPDQRVSFTKSTHVLPLGD